MDEGDDASDKGKISPVPHPSSAAAAELFRSECCVPSEVVDNVVCQGHLCPSLDLRWFSEDGVEHFDLNTYLRHPLSIYNCTSTIAGKVETWVAHSLKATRDRGRQNRSTQVSIYAAVHGAFLLAPFA
jgi:hypothetical protein